MSSPRCLGMKDWRQYCIEYDERKRTAKEVPSVIEEEGMRVEESGTTEEDVMVLHLSVEEKKEENAKLRELVENLKEKLKERADSDKIDKEKVIEDLRISKENNEQMKKKIEDMQNQREARRREEDEVKRKSEEMERELERLRISEKELGKIKDMMEDYNRVKENEERLKN